jgi:hypothetical protein
MIGRVLSVSIHRPGNSPEIAKNGWPCSHPGCNATPTVEIRFTRAARGQPGYTVGWRNTLLPTSASSSPMTTPACCISSRSGTASTARSASPVASVTAITVAGSRKFRLRVVRAEISPQRRDDLRPLPDAAHALVLRHVPDVQQQERRGRAGVEAPARGHVQNRVADGSQHPPTDATTTPTPTS